MAQYDGSIRINTNIRTKEAEIQLTTLENRMKRTADKITSLRTERERLENERKPTQAYQDIEKDIEKAERELNKLIEKQAQMQNEGKNSGAAWNTLNQRIQASKDYIEMARDEMQALVDSGKAFTLGSDTDEYKKLGQQLQYAENEMSILIQKHDVQYEKQKKVGNGYRNLAEKAKSAFSTIGNALKKTNSTVNAFGRKIRDTAKRHLPFFRKETEKVKSSLSGFRGRLKGLALSLLIFNQISAAFRAASSGISAGFKNLYDDNEQFKTSLDGLNASVLTLQNAFAAAFRPIVDIAVPYIQKLVEWLTEAVNLAGQFFAALAGRKTYTRAIRQTAAASEEAAEAAEDETEAMNKQLSPLDRLNNLTSENNKKKDKGKDDKGTGIAFEEVPIESNVLEMVDKVKDILSKLFAPLKEAWNREGKFVMDSWKYALDEVWKLIKDIGRDFLTVWQQEKTVKIFEDLLHIIGDIGLVVGHLARNFREAWNENETGLHILENIRDIIGAIVHNIRLAADKTVEWADKLDFKLLLEAFEQFTESLIPVADALSGVLTDFYTEVLLPFGKWTLEEGLPKLLDVFTDFNNRVDWQALKDNLAEFWRHLEPFAETVGEGLIIFIDRVSDALADFLNSQEFKDFLVMIEDWMDSVTPEDVADALEMIAKALIGLKITLLGFSAISAVTGALTTIKTFLSFFGIGGAGATAAKGIEETTAAIGGLSGALFGLAAAAAVVGSYKLLTGHMEELFAAFGKSTDQGRRLEERYKGIEGAATFAKDGIDILKNGIEGYGFAADNCVGSGVALKKAMEDIGNGAILSDQHMAELQKRFSLTNEDMEMLRQEMLDANPALRNLADEFPALRDASAESLSQINKGFEYMENGVLDADDIIFRLNHSFGELTPTTQDFFDRMANSSGSMEDFTYEMQTGEQVIDGYVASLENTSDAIEQFSDDMIEISSNIGEGLTAGMENVDTDSPASGFFSKLAESIRNVFGIHSPAVAMNPFGENIFLGVLEGFKSRIADFTALISQLFVQITAIFSSGMNSVKNAWSSAWSALPNTVKNIINSIMSMVSGFISRLLSAFGRVNSIASSISGRFSRRTSANTSSSFMASPYVANPAYATLADMPIPGYAKGQVIPRAMKQHLAILGDNNQETEIVSPVSMMKQAFMEAFAEVGMSGGNNGGGGIYQFAVDGRVFFEIMQKYAEEYKKQSGGSPAFG